MSDQKQSAFGAYYDNCQCPECVGVKAQLRSNQEPRFFGHTLADLIEMASDHATLQYALQCLAKDYDLVPKAESKNDAPYAFWLGAEAPSAKSIPYLPSQLRTYADWSSV